MTLALPPKPGLALPRHVHEATRAAKVSLTSDEFITPEQVREQIRKFTEEVVTKPTPVGWRLLVLMLTTPEQTAGGILLIDEERDRQAIVSPQGVVVGMGSMAYQSTSEGDQRYATGPWCNVGDRIIFQRYGGRAFRCANGQILITINDTDPMGVIDGGWI